MKKGPKKVITVILNVILWIVILTAAGVTIVSLATKEKGVSSIGNTIPFSIQTESMANTILPGDLIITSKYNGETELKENDIISFFAFEQDTKIVKTHRIVKVNKYAGGMLSYTTKGDNNTADDEMEVAPGDIISIYNGKRIAKVGYILSFLKSKYGFLLCIILPLFAIFIYQLYKFVALIAEERKKEIVREIEAAKNRPSQN